ncbi:protein EMBRYO DEFECTIVE 1674 [Fagus crenata]
MLKKTRRNSESATASNPKASPKSVPKGRNPITRGPTISIVSSSLFKSVSLDDWWLVKPPNGKGLALRGFASLGRGGIRAFRSAAISKRHNATTLETVDGIKILISGSINRPQTHQNGFPSKVCNHFLLGFPYNWEEYAVGCSGEEHGVSSSNEFSMSLGDSANETLPLSLDDLPVTRIHDLLMYSVGDRENCLLKQSIYNDILRKSKGDRPMKNVDSGPEETSVDDSNSNLNSRDMTKEEHQKASCHFEMGMNVLTPTRGVYTRSMTRLKNSRKEQEVSSNTHVKSTYSNRAILSDAARNRIRGVVTRSASKVSHPTKSFGEDNEAFVTSDKSTVRGSSKRLRNRKK